MSRLRDGREVVLARAQVHRRVASVLEEMDGGGEGLDAIVLLCTGSFPKMALKTPFISAQAAVDHGVMGVAAGAQSVGILVPHPEQAAEAERRGWPGARVKATHATPYADGRFEEAGRELADTDVVVMHCMGYDESMLRRVRGASGRPTLLARRLVASALRQIL